MAYEFKLPDLGEGLTEGEIARWLVAEGDEIAEDAPLVETATDKTTVEIPSPAAGLVSKILVQEGDVVPVGTVIVVIGGDGAASPVRDDVSQAPSAARPTRTGGDEKVRATPLVRRLAQELGVGLATHEGPGPRGRDREPQERQRVGDGRSPCDRRQARRRFRTCRDRALTRLSARARPRASTRSSAPSNGPRAERRPSCRRRARGTAPGRCGTSPRDRAARPRRPS